MIESTFNTAQMIYLMIGGTAEGQAFGMNRTTFKRQTRSRLFGRATKISRTNYSQYFKRRV